MNTKHCFLLLTVMLIIGIGGIANAQEITEERKDAITDEVIETFEKSREPGEQLDITGFSENINDSFSADFIDNGVYYKSFEDLMVNFKRGINGLQYQRINVDTKNVTVLSESKALLTADGSYSAKLDDGRTLTGRFAWTFVYSLIDGNWKVIHSHMSNP